MGTLKATVKSSVELHDMRITNQTGKQRCARIIDRNIDRRAVSC